MNENVFLALLANVVNSGHDRGECCLSAVFFALSTCWHVQFSKIFAFLFFLHKLTSICRQNWSCKEVPSSQNSDKAASLILSGSGKHERMYKKSATFTHFTINHAFQAPCSLFLPSKLSTLGYSCIFKEFLLSFIFSFTFHFSRGQSRNSHSTILFCSETKRKRSLRRLNTQFTTAILFCLVYIHHLA